MNDYYVNQLAKINKERYIDTSVVMRPTRLVKFINKAKDTLLENNIRIIVTKPVIEELTKHSLSNDKDKKGLAINGLKILNDNKDLFLLEEGADEDFNKAFADKGLLARLMNNRSNKSQMLITNDRNLAIDANKINGMKSINGGFVYVCYLDKDGELQKSDCVLTEELEEDSEEIYDAKSFEVPDALKIAVPMTLASCISYYFGRNHIQIFKFIKSFNRRVFIRQ